MTVERQPKRILLVEDDQAVAQLVKDALLDRDVLIAESVAQTLKTLEENPDNLPNLILLNLRLKEGESGKTLLNMLKSNEKYRGIPAAIFTSTPLSNDEEAELRELGAVDFIYQPFNLNELIDKTDRHLNDHRNLG